MRTELKKLNELRKRFKGKVESFGTKSGFKYPLPTILLTDVIMLATNKKVSDHCWLNFTKQFGDLDLKEGDIVEFDARVKEYTKGYMGDDGILEFEHPVSPDYKLSHPNKIRKINKFPKTL